METTQQPSRRAGRPRLSHRVVFRTTASPEVIARLREIGDGNGALGLVRCLDAFEILRRAGVELSSSPPPPAA